jgi:O-antigen/teichoic acid export membrane protein
VNRYYNAFTALTLLVIPLILIAAPLLIPVVIKKPFYYEAIKYLPILCLGFATRGWFYMFLAPIYFLKKTKALPRMFFISACIHLVNSTLLIHYFGLMGAVWANFLAKPVQAIILYFESRKYFSFSFNRWKIVYLPIIFILGGILCETIATDSTRLFLTIGQFILTSGLVFLVYRNELLPLARQWLRL